MTYVLYFFKFENLKIEQIQLISIQYSKDNFEQTWDSSRIDTTTYMHNNST